MATLTVGELRALLAGEDESTLVVIASDPWGDQSGGWYVHVDEVMVPDGEEGWPCVVLFPSARDFDRVHGRPELVSPLVSFGGAL